MSCMKVLSRIILLNILMVFLLEVVLKCLENNNGGNHSQKLKGDCFSNVEKKRAKTQIRYGSVWYSNGSGNSANENFGFGEHLLQPLHRMVLMADMIPLMMRQSVSS